MKDNKKSRALGLFSAMSQLPEGYVAAAEEELYAIEAGLRRPPKSQNAFVRFAHSGWCAAAISGIVALAVLALIIRAGSGPAPIVPPVGGTPTSGELESTAPEDDVALLDAADFTLSTDKQTYVEGITSFNVSLTGKTPGKDISLPGEWHLYRLANGAREPVVGMYYTDEAHHGIAPDQHTCATLHKTFFINPHNSSAGLAPGQYVLRACVDSDTNPEAAVECTFTVIPREDLTQSGTTPPPAEPVTPELDVPLADSADFTLSTDKQTYPEGTTSFVVTVTGKTPGKDLTLPGQWHLYRLVDGEREPVTGMYSTLESILSLAPDEHTCATMRKTFFINPHSSSAGLAPGTYVLGACADPNLDPNAVTECTFTVTARAGATDPDCTDTDDHPHEEHHEEHHGSATPGDMARVDMFYITDEMAYVPDNRTECEDSKVYISLPDLDCHDVVPFHHYITSDGKVWYLPAHHAHK
jgi:hypothetical protein